MTTPEPNPDLNPWPVPDLNPATPTTGQVPYSIGMGADNWHLAELWVMEATLTFMLCFNVAFQLNLAYRDANGALVTDSRLILENYRSKGGYYEMLAAFPFSAIAFLAGYSTSTTNWFSLSQMFIVIRVAMLEAKRLQVRVCAWEESGWSSLPLATVSQFPTRLSLNSLLRQGTARAESRVVACTGDPAFKTDETIRSWPHTASSAPWSSTPSLQRSICLAVPSARVARFESRRESSGITV